MIKPKYKNIFLLVITLLIIPNMVLAAWWNPLSWFNNWSFSQPKENEVEVLEREVNEFKKGPEEKESNSKEFATSTEDLEVSNSGDKIQKQKLIGEQNKLEQKKIKQEEIQKEKAKKQLKELLQKQEQSEEEKKTYSYIH